MRTEELRREQEKTRKKWEPEIQEVDKMICEAEKCKEQYGLGLELQQKLRKDLEIKSEKTMVELAMLSREKKKTQSELDKISRMPIRVE